MKKLFGYVRISTTKQAEKQTEMNQKKAIKDYCSENELEIVELFEDIAESGANANRKEFNRMIEQLDSIDGIVVYNIDRLMRDIVIAMDFMKIIMEKNILIHETSTNSIKDLNKDTDQLLYLIGSWASANERKKIKERQKIGIERYIENNKRWGPKIHYGRKDNGDRMTQREFIKEYTKLRNNGMSQVKIARVFKMNKETLYKRLHELDLLPVIKDEVKISIENE